MIYLVKWERVHALAFNLAERAIYNRDYDIILGVGRGGLIPAVMMSFQLNKPLLPVIWQVRNFRQSLIDFVKAMPDQANILIIDDINNTGSTLSELNSRLDQHLLDFNKTANTIDTCVLYERSTSSFKSTFYGELIEDDRVMSFPWEE